MYVLVMAAHQVLYCRHLEVWNVNQVLLSELGHSDRSHLAERHKERKCGAPAIDPLRYASLPVSRIHQAVAECRSDLDNLSVHLPVVCLRSLPDPFVLSGPPLLVLDSQFIIDVIGTVILC